METGKYISLIIFGASLGWLVTSPGWEPFIAVLGALGALLGLLKWESHKQPSFGLFRTREHYLDWILREVELAKTEIFMCVHTLAAPQPEDKLEKLHKLLAKKVRDGVDVRMLAPPGIERVQASHILRNYSIRVRHLPSLADTDMSFTLFDSSRSVIPTSSGAHEETVAGLRIQSTKLADLLKGYFLTLWSSHDALPFESFLRYSVQSAIHSPNAVPLSVFSERFHVPLETLDSILPAYGDKTQRRVFFIVGRPACGKTTVSTSLRRYLYAEGIKDNCIYQYNDYSVLYERFLDDHDKIVFEPVDRGGFRVRDFSVLDTVLKQADTQIRLAEQSHLALIVEFSRPSYLDALAHFDRSLVKNSIIILVRCRPETSEQRNAQRTIVDDQHTAGFVPPDIIRGFYNADDIEELRRAFGFKLIDIDTDRISLDQLDSYLADSLRAMNANKSMERML